MYSYNNLYYLFLFIKRVDIIIYLVQNKIEPFCARKPSYNDVVHCCQWQTCIQCHRHYNPVLTVLYKTAVIIHHK